MIYNCSNAFYFASINKIGGVESHFYYMAQKYGKYDIYVFYRNGDEDQIKRLKKYVRCVKLSKKDKVICNKLFVSYNRDIIDQCQADEIILVLHADYKNLIDRGVFTRNILPIDERITKYVGVSQLVCDSWLELTGINAYNLYQPVIIPKKDKPLMFISATRLSAEKGWDRMVKLADVMDKADINYTWLIYTDAKRKVKSKNMIFCEPRLDVVSKMSAFDAYIQLSDGEGYCLSIAEALMQGVPVICTDLPVLKEFNLNEKNSIILDFDMNNIPLNKIKKLGSSSFTYEPPIDKWDDILNHNESVYKGDPKYEVEALDTFKQLNVKEATLGLIPNPGDIFIVNEERFRILTGENRFNRPFVKIVRTL